MNMNTQNMSDVSGYHHDLFRWHCKNFYKFDLEMSHCELDYLYACFSMAEDSFNVSGFNDKFHSSYTYSHRIEGKRVNSSRLAYGSFTKPNFLEPYILTILKFKGIPIPSDLVSRDGIFWGGLGWDLMEDKFKIYLRLDKVICLPPVYLSSLGNILKKNMINKGGFSMVYRHNCLVEEKLYLYPTSRNDISFQSDVNRTTLMYSSTRGLVKQHDISAGWKWLSRLGPEARIICRKYAIIGEQLDTVNYVGPRHCTLYFP
jgi:hypothetical protein